MRKIFLTSGLVLCMVGSNAFAATDIDANGNVGGSAATCVYNVLDTYEGSSSFDAKWTPNNYTITFEKNTVDTNGATLVAQDGTTATPSGTMADQTFAYDSTANLTANAYSLTGYNFEDWLADNSPTNVNGGVVSIVDEDSITYTYPGNVTLTAQWYPVNSGAITLVSNVYPNNDRTQTALYTTSTGVTAPTTTTVHSQYNTALYSGATGATPVVAANLIPSKTGYTFNGFYKSAGTTQYIDGSGAVQGAGLRTVTTSGGTDTWYANWTPNLYEITYNPGTAGTHEVSGKSVTKAVYYDSTTYRDNSTLATLAGDTFSATGYNFAGWSSDHNVTTGANTTTLYNANTAISPYKVVGDTEMTAQWNPICYGAITLDSKKYSSSDDNTGVSPTSAASPSSIYVLYENGIYTDNACTSTTGLTNGNITIPTLTGYNFTGFYDHKNSAVNYWVRNRVIDQTGAITATGYGTITEETTLYAGWTPKTYNLTYTCGTAPSVTGLTIALDSNGVPPAATTGTYDDLTTVATNGGTCALDGDRGGYHFGGWFCNPNLSGGSGTTDVPSQLGENGWALSSGTIGRWRVDSDITCRFKWVGNDYTISYNHGTAGSRTTGFSGTMSDTTAKFGSSTTLTANAFSIPGYEFAGWSGDYNNSTGANTASAYTNEQRLTYILPNNLNLTAQWTPKTKTITYGCGSAPAGASTTVSGSGPSNGSATYDSTYDLSATYGTCVLPGYHATGWDCTGGATLTNATGTQSALSTDSDIACNVHWVANNIITNWDGNVGTIGTSGSQSCDYDSGITLPSSVTRPGFRLNGWTVTNSATLPSGYTRLDYIESTGTQYIDTGVSGFDSGNWEIYAKWMITEWTSYGTVFGVFDANESNTYRVMLQSTDNDSYSIAGNRKAVGGNTPVGNKPKNVIHTITLRNGSFEFDGQNYSGSSTTGTTLNSTTKMALFARSVTGGTRSKARIYSAWAKKDGVLQYYMIPARRSDNVLGMYDIVNDVFKTRSGSGTFIAGPPAQ